MSIDYLEPFISLINVLSLPRPFAKDGFKFRSHLGRNALWSCKGTFKPFKVL